MKRVLIVEDDSQLLKMYKQIFLNAAFSVDEAPTISKADGFIKKNKYDLILLDLLFPTSDTLPTIRLIRSGVSENTETPIIVLTNLEMGDKTKKALEYGANECLFKVTQTPRSIFEIAVKLIGDNNSKP